MVGLFGLVLLLSLFLFVWNLYWLGDMFFKLHRWNMSQHLGTLKMSILGHLAKFDVATPKCWDIVFIDLGIGEDTGDL